MALGLIVESYVARGLGAVVVSAAVTTAGLVMLLGTYAWTTKSDLRGLGGYLMAGLLAVIVASLVGIFLQAPLFHLILSAATALIFSGFVLYDIQRLRNAEGPSTTPCCWPSASTWISTTCSWQSFACSASSRARTSSDA